MFQVRTTRTETLHNPRDSGLTSEPYGLRIYLRIAVGLACPIYYA